MCGYLAGKRPCWAATDSFCWTATLGASPFLVGAEAVVSSRARGGRGFGGGLVARRPCCAWATLAGNRLGDLRALRPRGGPCADTMAGVSAFGGPTSPGRPGSDSDSNGPADVAAATDPEAIRALPSSPWAALRTGEDRPPGCGSDAIVGLLVGIVVLPGVRWRDLRSGVRRTWRLLKAPAPGLCPAAAVPPLMNRIVVRLLENDDKKNSRLQARRPSNLHSRSWEVHPRLQPGFGIDAARTTSC